MATNNNFSILLFKLFGSIGMVWAIVLWAAIVWAAACSFGEGLRGCKTITNPDGSTYCQCTEIEGAGVK